MSGIALPDGAPAEKREPRGCPFKQPYPVPNRLDPRKLELVQPVCPQSVACQLWDAEARDCKIAVGAMAQVRAALALEAVAQALTRIPLYPPP